MLPLHGSSLSRVITVVKGSDSPNSHIETGRKLPSGQARTACPAAGIGTDFPWHRITRRITSRVIANCQSLHSKVLPSTTI